MEEEGISLVAMSIVTVTVGVSSIVDSSGWQSTSTEVISSVEGPSSGREVATSSFEAPGLQGKGVLTSTEDPPVDDPVGGSGVVCSFTLTPEGDPLGGGAEVRGCLGLLAEEGGQRAGVFTRWTCN